MLVLSFFFCVLFLNATDAQLDGHDHHPDCPAAPAHLRMNEESHPKTWRYAVSVVRVAGGTFYMLRLCYLSEREQNPLRIVTSVAPQWLLPPGSGPFLGDGMGRYAHGISAARDRERFRAWIELDFPGDVTKLPPPPPTPPHHHGHHSEEESQEAIIQKRQDAISKRAKTEAKRLSGRLRDQEPRSSSLPGDDQRRRRRRRRRRQRRALLFSTVGVGGRSGGQSGEVSHAAEIAAEAAAELAEIQGGSEAAAAAADAEEKEAHETAEILIRGGEGGGTIETTRVASEMEESEGSSRGGVDERLGDGDDTDDGKNDEELIFEIPPAGAPGAEEALLAYAARVADDKKRVVLFTTAGLRHGVTTLSLIHI